MWHESNFGTEKSGAMLLSEDYLMFVKCFEDEHPFIHIMAMDYHWSHVALLWNWDSEELETTSNSKTEERHRHRKY